MEDYRKRCPKLYKYRLLSRSNTRMRLWKTEAFKDTAFFVLSCGTTVNIVVSLTCAATLTSAKTSVFPSLAGRNFYCRIVKPGNTIFAGGRTEKVVVNNS
ncbi:MAG: hypothetical protein JWQ40_55 [Segetibacter sp.]|nr:hypothetical protein [Segetibacter sp.]